MKHSPTIDALLRHIEQAQPFRRFLKEEGGLLLASAELLGDSPWARPARALVQAARAGRDLSARRSTLALLHRLLHLDFTQELGSEEATCFAALYPGDPEADLVRRCAEALDRGLRAIEALRLAGLFAVREAA